MKFTFTLACLLLGFIFVSPYLFSQDLSKRGLELRAHYPLKSNGVDLTGNYDTISYGDHAFVDSSILSKGCARIHDTCLIETPQINHMNDNAFAIRVEFKMWRFGGPIVIAGKGYRYLGVASSGLGKFGIKTGSQDETIYDDIQLTLDTWYTATIIHNTADLITEVYLDDKFIAQRIQGLNHPEDDNVISNIDFSRGYSFSGYIRNLQVYSTDLLKASDDSDLESLPLRLFPNPAVSELRIAAAIGEGATYQIANMDGKVLQTETLSGNSVDVEALARGMYMLFIYEEGILTKRARFIKK